MHHYRKHSLTLFIKSKITKENDLFIMHQSYFSLLLKLDNLKEKDSETFLSSINILPKSIHSNLFDKIYVLNNKKKYNF
jgi:hypothetical protein